MGAPPFVPIPPTDGEHLTKWHPPDLQNGAFLYEDFSGFFRSIGSGFAVINVNDVPVVIWIGPSQDPQITGAVFNDNGTLKVSAGIA